MDTTTQSNVHQTGTSSRGAMVRKVTRRDGKSTWIRIDDVENSTPRPHFRTVSLEEYIEQVRRKQLKPIAADQVQDRAHIEAMEVVARIDSGFQWLEEANREAAAQSAEAMIDVQTDLGNQPSGRSEISSELVHEIAVAIADVLTGSQDQGSASTEVPLLGREEVSDLVLSARSSLTAHHDADRVFVSTPERKSSQKEEQEIRIAEEQQESNELSLTAAAWKVDQFKCPQVVKRLICQPAIMRLADYSGEMLTPFGKTIAVTSPQRGTGVTTMALALGQVLARSGRRALLIDANMENNGLSQQVGLQKMSWLPIVDPIGESIVCESVSGLCVMPLNPGSANGMLHGISTLDLLEISLASVRSEFDVVIIDAGEVNNMIGGLSAANHLLDAVVIVADDVQSDGFIRARENLVRHGIYKFVLASNEFRSRAA